MATGSSRTIPMSAVHLHCGGMGDTRIDARHESREALGPGDRQPGSNPMRARAIVLIASLAAAFLLGGCQASGSQSPTPPGNNAFKYGRGDGQTMATAVEIRTRSETEGGVLIRDWIKANYPGYAIQQQELMEQRDRAYNMITIIGPSNTSHQVYFDVSTFYRRIGNDNFPKPL